MAFLSFINESSNPDWESTKRAYWDPDNTIGFTSSAFDLRLQASFLEALLLEVYMVLTLGSYLFWLFRTYPWPLKFGKTKMDWAFSVCTRIPCHAELFG